MEINQETKRPEGLVVFENSCFIFDPLEVRWWRCLGRLNKHYLLLALTPVLSNSGRYYRDMPIRKIAPDRVAPTGLVEWSTIVARGLFTFNSEANQDRNYVTDVLATGVVNTMVSNLGKRIAYWLLTSNFTNMIDWTRVPELHYYGMYEGGWSEYYRNAFSITEEQWPSVVGTPLPQNISFNFDDVALDEYYFKITE